MLIAKEILLGMVNQPSHGPDGGDPALRWWLLCAVLVSGSGASRRGEAVAAVLGAANQVRVGQEVEALTSDGLIRVQEGSGEACFEVWIRQQAKQAEETLSLRIKHAVALAHLLRDVVGCQRRSLLNCPLFGLKAQHHSLRRSFPQNGLSKRYG